MLVPFEILPIQLLRKIHEAALGTATTMRDRKKIGRKLALIVDGEDRDLSAKVLTKARTLITLEKDKNLREAVNEFRKAATAGGCSMTIKAGGKTVDVTPPPTSSDMDADAKRHEKLKSTVDKAIDKALGSDDDPPVENVSAGTTAQRIRSAVAQLPEKKARHLLADVGGSFLAEEQLRAEKKEKRKEYADEIKENTAEIIKSASDPTNNPDPVAALAKIDVLHTKNKKLDEECSEVTASYDDDITKARDRIRHVLDNLNQEKLPGIE